ncbi:hypothetical protein ACFQU2_12900 [Siccirubricoccus deserti]
MLLVPAFGLGAMAAWQSIQSHQREFESRLHDTARALALALDSELEAVRVAAMALATSPCYASSGMWRWPALPAGPRSMAPQSARPRSTSMLRRPISTGC